MPLPTQAEFEAMLTTAEVDFGKLHAVVHGAVDDPDVVTEGGNVPTLAKQLAAVLAANPFTSAMIIDALTSLNNTDRDALRAALAAASVPLNPL